MASYITDMEEIHQIIFETPDSSDDSGEDWSDDSEENTGNNSEPEHADSPRGEQQNREERPQASASAATRRPASAVRRRRNQTVAQTSPAIQWSDVNERFLVDYPDFQGPDHGPTFAFVIDSEPIVFFDQLFTNELWDLLVTETNRYARQKHVNGWQDTSREEMRCFVGFLFGISINKIAEINDVWSSDWVVAYPAYASFFTKDRFWELWSCIHLIDNEKAPERNSPEFDKLYKVRPIMEILGKSFKENFNLGQNVSVDEAMVKGKGRNPLKQYMPAKPIKRGSKLWCVGCSCCAYLWDFQIYTGKVAGASEDGLSSRVVCDLCHPVLDNRNHVVYMDNFFSSVALCKKLKSFGTFSVGTLRSNRKDYPTALKEKVLLKNLKRGDYHTASSDGMTVTVWKDTKDVSFISNVHSSKGHDTVGRKQKHGSVKNISAPPVVKDYNANMGAIDRHDQLKKSYAIDRKSRRWWVRIFLHLLDICRVNAFILYGVCYQMWNSGPMEEEPPPLLDQKQFTSSLVRSLCGTFTCRKKTGRPPAIPLPLVRSPGHESVNVVKAGAKRKGRCHYCAMGPNKRARVETRFGCVRCSVRLCPDKCHDLYHARLAEEDS